jgi:23S rRNA (adenine2503-C2)-methyltransferase
MKKILQDLSYQELEELTLALGEKKFRAKQLYDGIMQGKTIDAITSLSKAFKEKLKEVYENEPIKIKETYYSLMERKNIYSSLRTAILSKAYL